ncbi:MAG: type II toxin-antitoxin system RelE/ParE family toxin [Bacillota bacterium]|nr:type II toxin-antitoxin system RelE/ParE family toxin [Bacillota bacterium]
MYSYISQELFAVSTANNLLERLERSIMSLRDFPFSCNLVADELLKKKGYRKLIVDNYIIFYIVDEFDKRVVIMRVLYGRQKYQDIL